MKKRYLTKSRFKLATECPTKLFYTGKKCEYANQSLDDSFLLALADDGIQVGALAQSYFQGGYEIKTLDYKQALNETNELLQSDKVTIFEAAIATEKLFIRVDVLVKDGNHLDFYEVKAKSFDPTEIDPFCNKSGAIDSNWRPYLYDVAFQRHVINLAYPQYTVSAYLMLADKTAPCPTDGLNQKFRLVKDQNGQASVSEPQSLTSDDLTPQILCEVNVDAECDQISDGKGGGNEHSLNFAQRVELYADHYIADKKIPSPISRTCAKCEFNTTDDDEKNGLKSGRKECWKDQLGWSDDDFESPTVLDVWKLDYRIRDKLINDGRIKMSDITREYVKPSPDRNPGISGSERRWLQVEKYQAGDDTVWFDKDGLHDELDSWVYPLHFIDFEAARVAIPFNAGRRPYEAVAFQFSHHIVYDDGTIEHFGEYLNVEQGSFPNYEFLRNLKTQLEKDDGSIFQYTSYENTILNAIHRQLTLDEAVEDRVELCEFIESISQPTRESVEKWVAQKRNMVDLHEVLTRFYFDPATNGSNSIKVVLPAILNRSNYLQDKYSKPIYGSLDGIKSHNFKDKRWIEKESGKVVDPYKLLPKMFQDIDDKDIQLLSNYDSIKEGGAAMTAYARMQSEEMSEIERKEIGKALRKYCELDTMAMVMIYEGWKDLVTN